VISSPTEPPPRAGSLPRIRPIAHRCTARLPIHTYLSYESCPGAHPSPAKCAIDLVWTIHAPAGIHWGFLPISSAALLACPSILTFHMKVAREPIQVLRNALLTWYGPSMPLLGSTGVSYQYPALHCLLPCTLTFGIAATNQPLERC